MKSLKIVQTEPKPTIYFFDLYIMSEQYIINYFALIAFDYCSQLTVSLCIFNFREFFDKNSKSVEITNT